MFDRAAASLISGAAICAATVLGVFAAGFALYAAVAQMLHSPAWAATIVALVAFVIAGVLALFAKLRSAQQEREAAAAQAELLDHMPHNLLGEFAKERPLLTLAISVLGGAVAARNPRLVSDLVGLAARFTGR